jgi:hypothetical protein
MLFMNVYTIEPAQRNEVLKMLLEKGLTIPEGFKVIGEWTSLAANRGFMLFETDDPKTLLAAKFAWTDLMNFEIVPVIETKEAMNWVKSHTKA